MTREQLIESMIVASKEDRARFFAVADTLHLQPKYADYLTELETLKQYWRDMTDLENYPEVKFPFELPEWFPSIKFMSSWETDFVEKMVSNSST